MSATAPLIPVTLLSGFLGSGKTTVLNHLLRQPALADTLVIINEYGEIALDHLLVKHSREDLLMELSSGCLCCTIRGDLVQTLAEVGRELATGERRPLRRVLIETTGLADPAPIIHTLMTHTQVASRYRLDGIVVTVDLAAGAVTLASQPEALKQVAVADVLLLTKGDLVSAGEGEVVLARLQQLNPAAPRWPAPQGVVEAERLLDLGLFSSRGEGADVERWLNEPAYRPLKQPVVPRHLGTSLRLPPANRHDGDIRSFCLSLDEPLADSELSDWLELLMSVAGSHILRVKGIVNIQGRERPVVLHSVQHIFHPPVWLPAWPSADRRTRLVFITRGVEREVVEGILLALRGAVAPIEEQSA
ncbi:GTP-binding protein [Pseudomonas sp. PA15(2017)]|uniref:CobW family GTP-binding protein n=1 Tax=Pseudomonas sp. PA15(2017) TaxID=1932111 RepID=UPI00095A1F9D|nr:GTP-binding protein [Pseudomonas sp. PA15(2017)]OLU22377.1 GTP-binding protein [Pseudomonas sp. PA15(2017)]